MRKKSILGVLLAVVMLFGVFAGCNPSNNGGPAAATEHTVTFDVGSEAQAAGVRTPEPQVVQNGSTAVQPTIDAWEGHTLIGWYKGNKEWDFSSDTVTEDITLKAQWNTSVSSDKAEAYERSLDWGEKDHLYIHYLRGAHSESEEGTTNTAAAPGYSSQIESDIYGDWGLWVWEYFPTNGEGRAFYPMKIDESGAVYDIDLKATYTDAGWNEETRNNKGFTITYSDTLRIGIQIYSQYSRLYEEGFWVNDGGDVYIVLEEARRDKGDYHWFVRQGEVKNGTPTFASYVVFDPYAGLEEGSAVTTYDVVSSKGNNGVYLKQDVAEGWEEESVGYQIFMASFADSDGDGMGDIRGIIQNLDYLEKLGVDVLWLTPFQQSNSYHGYDIMDYFTVDPRFGTLDDYRELVYEVHQRGMRILLDFVLNHTSTSNPWFIKSQNLVKETVKMPDGSYKEIDYRNFYTWKNADYYKTITDPLEKLQWFKDSNGYYYYSSFNSSMPELNFDYQATRDAILQVALYWMSFGLDGFRLDAVKHIYMENESYDHSDQIIKDISKGTEIGSTAGDYSFDMKKDAHFFMEFNAKLKASYPGAILVGENFNGDPIKIAGLYEGLDSQFNFNWYYDTTGCLGVIANSDNVQSKQQYASKAMNQYAAAQFDFRLYRTDYIDGIFTSNHDVQRARDRVMAGWNEATHDWVSNGLDRENYTQDEWNTSESLAKLWAGMCLTVPGITWIYGGDELGMFGVKTPNPENEGPGHEDRWLRQPLKWSKTKEGSKYNCNYPIGFNNYKMTWDALNEKLDGIAEQEKDDNSMLSVYKKLIQVRKQNPTLARGTVVNHTKTFTNSGGETVICYSVKDAEHEILVYVNASKQQASSGYAVPANSQLLYGAALESGRTMQPLSMTIYKVK